MYKVSNQIIENLFTYVRARTCTLTSTLTHTKELISESNHRTCTHHIDFRPDGASERQ